MPELPEVETVRRILLEKMPKKKICDVLIYRNKNVFPSSSAFINGVVGRKIVDLSRRGKYLIFHLDDGQIVLSHLRMEGHYEFRAPGEGVKKYDILKYVYSDGSGLVYVDSRRFGTLELLASKEDLDSTSVGKLGPEPFDLDLDDFYKALQKRNDPIKEALLDQTLVAGIGNIYDSEILFAAKIHPLESCKNIKKEQLPLLKEAMVNILGRAIELGGSTIDTFHPDLGVDGRMQLELKAYGQEGMPCPECGKKIRRIMLGGRGTYYCPHCQKRMHAPLVLGVTGPIHAGKSTVSAYYVNQGFALFDADKEVKELYRDKQVQKDIKKLLGRSAFLKGKVNADYMRIALSEKKKKKALENYLDPLLLKKAKKAIADCKAPGIVLDIPRLFPSGFGDLCDEVILVESQESTRAKRLFDEGRDVDGLMKLNASYPLFEARKRATHVIENEGSKAALEEILSKIKLG